MIIGEKIFLVIFSGAPPTGTDIVASLKGTPLESLAKVVASLPKQISTLIKDKATLMFSLFHELKEWEDSLYLYDKEIVNKETGETVEYRPKCCRHTNPITYSCFLQENNKLKETLAKYDQLIKDFNSKGTKLLRMVAKLEVEACIDGLCKEIIETLHSLVNNFIIFEVIKNKTYIPPLTTNLPSSDLAMSVIDQTIREFTAMQATALQFDSKDQLMEVLKNLIDQEVWDEDLLTKTSHSQKTP